MLQIVSNFPIHLLGNAAACPKTGECVRERAGLEADAFKVKLTGLIRCERLARGGGAAAETGGIGGARKRDLSVRVEGRGEEPEPIRPQKYRATNVGT